MARIDDTLKPIIKTAGKSLVKTGGDIGPAVAGSIRKRAAKGKDAHRETTNWDRSQNPKADKPKKNDGPDVDPELQARIDVARTAKERLADIKSGKRSEPNWGDLTTKYHGPKPPDMERPHGHHIVFKNGNGPRQRELLERAKDILERNGIDWLEGPENLTWAPNVKGQHTLENVETVLDLLEAADPNGPSAVAEALRNAGRGVFGGRP